jgi:peptide/nickel transport system ATP-binding protein
VRCVRVGELPFGGPHDDAPDLVPSPRADATTLLSVRGLTASYARSAAVDSVSWTLAPRECLAVVGESGSGKTTLARCLVGLHTRWSGEVVFKGTPLAHSVRERSPSDVRLIQYVFQNPYGSLNPRRRIREILEQPLKRFYSLSANERLDRMALALENAAVEAHVLDRTPGELSGGERQRVAIARALTVEPQVLVCDEITSALDVSVQAAIVETLRRLQEERSLALVFITHNLALVRSIAQRVVVMRHGRVVESGPTEDVLGHPGADYTRKLLTDVPKLDSYDVPST